MEVTTGFAKESQAICASPRTGIGGWMNRRNFLKSAVSGAGSRPQVRHGARRSRKDEDHARELLPGRATRRSGR